MKRESRVSETVGPGNYSPERADLQVRSRAQTIDFSQSAGRDHSGSKYQDNSGLSPGDYDDRSYEWGKDSKGFTIGERREERLEETMGPGAYDIDRADKLTKTKQPDINMGSSPGRPARIGQTIIPVATNSQNSSQRYTFSQV